MAEKNVFSSNRFGHGSELDSYLVVKAVTVVRIRCSFVNVYFVAGYTDNLSALGLKWWNKMFDFHKFQERLENFRFVSYKAPCYTLYILQCNLFFSTLIYLRSPLLWSSHHCQCQTPQKRQWSRSPRKWTNLMIIHKLRPSTT